jgi:hypothetical protein
MRTKGKLTQEAFLKTFPPVTQEMITSDRFKELPKFPSLKGLRDKTLKGGPMEKTREELNFNELRLDIARQHCWQVGRFTEKESLKVLNQLRMVAPCNLAVCGLGVEASCFERFNADAAAQDIWPGDDVPDAPTTLFIENDSEKVEQFKKEGRDIQTSKFEPSNDLDMVIVLEAKEAYINWAKDRRADSGCWIFVLGKAPGANYEIQTSHGTVLNTLSIWPGKLKRKPFELR